MRRLPSALGRRRLPIAAAGTLLAPAAVFLLLDSLFPFPTASLHRPPAVVVRDREGEPLRILLPADERYRFPLPLEAIPPELRRAVVALEDRRFDFHPGIDPLAIARAAWTNLRAGRVVSGASTLTMQIARLAEPAPRTLQVKCREAFRALQLEWRFDKDELLAIYFNLAPYGGNLEGAGAAAWFWFGKPVERLSLGEAALLAVLPRSPRLRDPVEHSGAARAARDAALRSLARLGVFPAESVAAALRQELPRRRLRPPFVAPHFCQLASDALPGEASLLTTLDRTIQLAAEQQVAAHIGSLRRLGVGNTAAVVIENEGRAVRAMVGSAGFSETAFQGQVNAALARRSPGSALKPLLYALAMESGKLGPDSWLLDVPADFAGYVAENYDGLYRGRVTVTEALAHSLNAPAVRLLADTGLRPFLDLLRRGGLRTLDRTPAEYGLPLILGSGEVTLLDLTNLYASLAQDGRHAPWRLRARDDEGVRKSGAEAGSQRLFSAETARLVTEILHGTKRPDLPSSWDLTRAAPAVAWKTGTSYGHRDAWAIGYSARTTIGVWVGNPDGRPLRGLSGADHAAPLLFDLFRAIESGATRLPEPRGLRIGTLEACAVSRALPGPFCPRRETIRHIPGRTRLSTCTLHRRVFLDEASGLLIEGDCLSGRSHRTEVIEVHPPELIAWWRAQGRPVPRRPAASPECGGVPAGERPMIVSPSSTTTYRLRHDAPEDFQRIPLIARAGAGTGRLWWYLDGTLAASGSPGSRLFLPPGRGTHRLVVVDDAGRSDGVTYTIE